MATAELSLENLKRHIGRRQVATDVITAGPANLLRLAFGRAEREFQTGDQRRVAAEALRLVL